MKVIVKHTYIFFTAVATFLCGNNLSAQHIRCFPGIAVAIPYRSCNRRIFAFVIGAVVSKFKPVKKNTLCGGENKVYIVNAAGFCNLYPTFRRCRKIICSGGDKCTDCFSSGTIKFKLNYGISATFPADFKTALTFGKINRRKPGNNETLRIALLFYGGKGRTVLIYLELIFKGYESAVKRSNIICKNLH